MSSICLTCESNNLTENCVFTAQGDLQCYNPDAPPQEEQFYKIEREMVTTPPGTPASQIYPVSGVDDQGYYRYISDLSGQPIQMRYGQTIPAEVTNACAAASVTVKNNDSRNAVGIPEWGPYASWISKKDAGTLKDPYMVSDRATYS